MLPKGNGGARPKTNQNQAQKREDLVRENQRLQAQNAQLEVQVEKLIQKLSEKPTSTAVGWQQAIEQGEVNHAKRKTALEDSKGDKKNKQGKKGKIQPESESKKGNAVQTDFSAHLLTENPDQPQGASNYVDTSCVNGGNFSAKGVCSEGCSDESLWEKLSPLLINQRDVYTTETTKKNERHKEESGNLREKNRELEIKIGELERQISKLETNLRDQETDLKRQASDKDAKIDSQNSEIAEFKKQLAAKPKSEELQGVAAQSGQIDTEEQKKLNKKIVKLQEKVKELEETLKEIKKELKDYKSKNNPQELQKTIDKCNDVKKKYNMLKQLLENQKRRELFHTFDMFGHALIAYVTLPDGALQQGTRQQNGKGLANINPDTKIFVDSNNPDQGTETVYSRLLKERAKNCDEYNEFDIICNTCEQVFPIGEYMDSQHHTTYASAVVAGLNVSVYSAGTDLQSVL